MVACTGLQAIAAPASSPVAATMMRRLFAHRMIDPFGEVPRHGRSLDEYTTRSRASRILDDWLGVTFEADWEGDY
jgi:hypothetical protein